MGDFSITKTIPGDISSKMLDPFYTTKKNKGSGLGLGLGAYWGGLLSDKWNDRKPGISLKFYAYAEFIIALVGLILSILIPFLEPLSAMFTSYTIGKHNWYYLSSFSYLFRYITSIVLLFPL